MTCMTSVGFGNVAPETDNEKIFTICMMVIGGMYYIFHIKFNKIFLIEKRNIKNFIHHYICPYPNSIFFQFKQNLFSFRCFFCFYKMKHSGLKHLALRDLLLNPDEARYLLDNVTQNCFEQLRTLTLINCCKNSFTFLHVGIFINLEILVISCQVC